MRRLAVSVYSSPSGPMAVAQAVSNPSWLPSGSMVAYAISAWTSVLLPQTAQTNSATAQELSSSQVQPESVH